MTTKKEVAKKDQTAVALDNRPDFLKNNSNRGSEEVGTGDITLPRISIVQDLSPQLKKSKPEYIEGAEVGDMFNTITNELFKDSVNVVPVYLQKQWIIWKLRKQGGGFFGAFDSEQEAIKELPNLEGNANDYEVVDTDVHYVLLVDGGKIQEAVVSMAKSQKKVSRQWNTQIKMVGGDRFSRVYALGTTDDSNKNGDEYQNYTVKPVGYVTEDVYHQAEEVYEAIRAGARKVKHEDSESSSSPDKAEQAESGKDFDDEFAE